MQSEDPKETGTRYETTRKSLIIWAVLIAASAIFAPYVAYVVLNTMPHDVVMFMCVYSVCPTFFNVWIHTIVYFVFFFGPPIILSIIAAIILDLLVHRKR